MERRASLMLKEVGGSFRRVYCRNILYVESANRKVILHLENGETIESYAKLDELEQQLPGRLFFRCHQSYIISLYFVEKNGYRQVHSPVCRNSCFPEISARGAGNVL